MNYELLATDNWRLNTSHELPATSDKQPATSDALRQDDRTKKPFYAKQTQFPPILRQKRLFGRKTNPIKPNSKPIQSQSNPILHHIRRKQTQTNTISNQPRAAIQQNNQ